MSIPSMSSSSSSSSSSSPSPPSTRVFTMQEINTVFNSITMLVRCICRTHRTLSHHTHSTSFFNEINTLVKNDSSSSSSSSSSVSSNAIPTMTTLKAVETGMNYYQELATMNPRRLIAFLPVIRTDSERMFIERQLSSEDIYNCFRLIHMAKPTLIELKDEIGDCYDQCIEMITYNTRHRYDLLGRSQQLISTLNNYAQFPMFSNTSVYELTCKIRDEVQLFLVNVRMLEKVLDRTHTISGVGKGKTARHRLTVSTKNKKNDTKEDPSRRQSLLKMCHNNIQKSLQLYDKALLETVINIFQQHVNHFSEPFIDATQQQQEQQQQQQQQQQQTTYPEIDMAANFHSRVCCKTCGKVKK